MFLTNIRSLFAYLEKEIALFECRRRNANIVPKISNDSGNVFDIGEVRDLVSDYDVVSFDLFDTLLHRKHLGLEGVQRHTAMWGSGCIPGNETSEIYNLLYGCRGFYSDSYKSHLIDTDQGDEPLLNDLFENALKPIITDGKIRRTFANMLVEFETNVEIENLRTGEGVRELLTDLRDAGKTIIVITDMYLPASSIERILSAFNLMELIDGLYVSSEASFTKNRGSLYGIVSKDLAVPSQKILHIGDNWHNDVVMAKKNNFGALHYFNRKEEIQKRALDYYHQYIPTMITRKKLISDQFEVNLSRRPKGLSDIVAGIIGPAFSLSVFRMLKTIQSDNIQAVYFLTRDGTIFRDIADVIVEELPIVDSDRVVFRTLAVSRSSWAILEFENLDDIDWLVDLIKEHNNGKFSIGRLLDQFNIEVADVVQGMSRELANSFLSNIEEDDGSKFVQLFEEFPKLRKHLENALLKKRDELEKYLEQEKLYKFDRVAFVDIGYSATIGKMLSKTFARRDFSKKRLPQISFLFVATNQFMLPNIRSFHPNIRPRAGLLISHERQSSKPLMFNSAWLEPFSADLNLGKFRGYLSDGKGKLVPKFDDPVCDDEDLAKNKELRFGLVDSAKRFSKNIMKSNFDEELLYELLLERIARLCCQPTRAEIKAMSELRHQEGMNTVSSRRVFRKIKWLSLHKEFEALKRDDYWIQGSYAYSGLGLWNLIRFRVGTSDKPIPLKRAI